MKAEKPNILLTASGLSPVGVNTALALVPYAGKLVGVDINKKNTAKLFCDKFYQVPLAANKKYLESISAICQKEKIAVIFPLTIEETLKLLENKTYFAARKIAIANNNSLEIIKTCNDKWLTNQFLKEKEIIAPSAFAPQNLAELLESAKKLGYPRKKIAFKPRITHGSRGFRIISAKFDRYNLLLNEKPTENIYLNLSELADILKLKKTFPKVMLMDYLEGDDYSVYTFSSQGESLVILPMKRSGLLPGMSLGGELDLDKKIITYIQSIIKAFKFSGAVNLQLKNTKQCPRLYEINTRISASTVFARGVGFNFPWLEVLLALGRQDEARKEIEKCKKLRKIKMYRIQREIFQAGNTFFEI